MKKEFICDFAISTNVELDTDGMSEKEIENNVLTLAIDKLLNNKEMLKEKLIKGLEVIES